MSLFLARAMPLWMVSSLTSSESSKNNDQPIRSRYVDADFGDEDNGMGWVVVSISAAVVFLIVGIILLITYQSGAGFWVGIGFLVAACCIVGLWVRAILAINNNDDKNK